MTFIFRPKQYVQGNLTRVHHRLKRNDNDHHHHRETIISIWWNRNRWHHRMNSIYIHLQMLDITWKWLFVKRLSWLESISVVFVSKKKNCCSVKLSPHVVSCLFSSNIVNRLFCVYSTTTKKIALDCSVFSAHFLNGCTPNAY